MSTLIEEINEEEFDEDEESDSAEEETEEANDEEDEDDSMKDDESQVISYLNETINAKSEVQDEVEELEPYRSRFGRAISKSAKVLGETTPDIFSVH